jgi:hypothetical protein
MAGDGWKGILFPGERVIWQGQPDPRPDWSEVRLRDAIFGLAVAAFAVFWMTMAAGTADGLMSLVFPLFALPFLAIGLRKAGAMEFWQAWKRRRTWYTLTDRRAFIATDLFGRRGLDAYPIGPRTPLRHENDRDIFFATDFVKTRRGSRRRRIGFTHLPDSAHVHALMQQVQREAT